MKFCVRLWETLVFSEEKPFYKCPALFILRVCSIFYGSAVTLRNRLYDAGVFCSFKAEAPVISIGNLSVGGTGKTTLAIWCAQALLGSGKKPVILSRGYGRTERKNETVIVSDGSVVLENSRTAGDEPCLIAGKIKNVPVIVGADRRKSSALAVEKFRPGCIILDDGFQHRRLKRDLDIVCLDESVLKAPYMFPRGILRECARSLERAGFVVIKTETMNKKAFMENFEKVFSYNINKPCAVFAYGAGEVFDREQEKPVLLEFLKGKSVTAFSAIAHPESFEKILKNAGSRVISTKRFPDHHAYSAPELESLFNASRENGSVLITTEKDAVKLPEKFPAYVLSVHVKWSEGKEYLEKSLAGVFKQ